MSEVLGRLTNRATTGPRGPDVVHRIEVRPEWLTSGEVIEFELPRNLACAACRGGGCDACGRAGAITLRERGEPAEVLEVTLPVRAADDEPDSRSITLRIPEQGGLPEAGSDLPRGVLLLTVVASLEADPNVKLACRLPSQRPPASIAAGAEEHRTSLGPRRVPFSPALVLAVVALALWVLLLIWLRLSGRG